MHKMPYKECRLEHAEWQLLLVRRRMEVVEEWLKEAKRLTGEFLRWKGTLEGAGLGRELIGMVPMDGVFTEACTFCGFLDWCKQGRPIGGMDDMEGFRWEPWGVRRDASKIHSENGEGKK